MQKIRIWDLPTRAFHWLFAVAVLGAIITNLFDAMDLHSYCGYAVLVLVIFRLIWGVIGPTHARFKSFIPSLATLREFIKTRQSTTLGHNPFGALSVIAILVVVLVQASTGLFTDDEIAFQGPLSKYVSEDIVKLMNQIHETNHWLVYGLVVFHLMAIFYYQRIKKENLLMPMISGDKEVEELDLKSLESRDDMKTRVLGIAILLVLVGVFKYFVLG
jgi:cytochrome b